MFKLIKKQIAEVVKDIETVENWCSKECTRKDNEYKCAQTCKLGATREQLYIELDTLEKEAEKLHTKYITYTIYGIILISAIISLCLL